MKNLKSKAFFIYSFIFYIILSIVLILISWQIFEPNAYNFMVKNFTALENASDDIVLVVIDDKSTAKYRWPWKRELYAQIFEYLNDYCDTKLIGFDAIVANLDKDNPQSDKEFFDTVKKTSNLVVGFSLIDDKPLDAKAAEIYEQAFYDKFGTNIEDKREKYIYPSKYGSFSKFPKAYFDAVQNTGSVNSTRAPSNGYLIFNDLIISLNKKYYPSLSLKMYMLLNGADKLTMYDESVVVEKTGLTIPTMVSYNGLHNYIKFYKIKNRTSFSHKKYSAVDILDSLDNIKAGKPPVINPDELKGKIVFVGGNAKASAIKVIDAQPTPMLHEHPGVDIQAINLSNFIKDDLMKISPLKFDLCIILLLSILTFAVINRFTVFKSILILVLTALGYLGFAGFCYRHDFGVNVVTPLGIQLVTMIFAYSYRFIVEGKNKEKIKQAMGKYLSQDIMQNVVKNIDDIKLGGKRANVTVLFADIRGFTSMSEKMTAEEVSKILNEYFTEIEPIITKYNGVINKFIGDAVMAIFGEPIQDLNHPVNAVKCAYEMLKKVDELRDKWLFEGKPKIEIGIGINTGDAFVGNIGSEKRLEYTVIGDTVNLASRIESYNKVYRTNFLISSSTYSYVSNIADVIKISEVTIRGKAKKMDIYEVLRIS